MTEMREKIARAIYAVFLRGCCPHETATFDTDDEDVRVFCRAVADAVLALIAPVMEENERLRGTLEKIVDHESNVSDDHTECENCHDAFFDDYFEVRALARSALSTKSEKQDG
jgi:hypothetical protein